MMGQYFWFGIFTFANTLLVFLLAVNVSRLRMRERIAHGDGGSVPLKKAIRAHGNGVEHLVVVGFQVLALELNRSSSLVLMVLVAVFTMSRILHALGMLGSRPRLRQIGALGTYVSELGGVLAVLSTLAYI